MGRMSDKQVTIITAAAMALLAIGLGAATYFVFMEKHKSAKADLDKQKGDLASWNKKETELNKWKQDLPELLRKDAENIDILPTKVEKKPQEFYDAVFQLARESNAIIRSGSEVVAKATGPVRPGPGAAAPAAGGVDKVTYKYRVEGEFYHVAAFLSRLEGMKRFVKVMNVKLTPSVRTIMTIDNVKITKTYAFLDTEINFYFLK